MTLRVVRLDARATLPARAHPEDAGLDLHALQAATLGPGERASIPTGIAVEIEPGHAGLVLPRSGLAARHGIALTCVEADFAQTMQEALSPESAVNQARPAGFSSMGRTPSPIGSLP